MNLIEAFVWNVGSCRPDAKGETQGGSPTKGERTNAGHSGGITCSSEELPNGEGVKGLYRSALFMGQPEMGGASG